MDTLDSIVGGDQAVLSSDMQLLNTKGRLDGLERTLHRVNRYSSEDLIRFPKAHKNIDVEGTMAAYDSFEKATVPVAVMGNKRPTVRRLCTTSAKISRYMGIHLNNRSSKSCRIALSISLDHNAIHHLSAGHTQEGSDAARRDRCNVRTLVPDIGRMESQACPAAATASTSIQVFLAS
jgi:hypothetical protein